MDTDNKSKERRTHFEAELGKLAVKRWRMESELKGLDETMRLLNGAVQEAEIGEREMDSILAIVRAKEAEAKKTTPADKPPTKIVEAQAKKPKK
jgi:hypothetical protein